MAGQYDHLFITHAQVCGDEMVNEGDRAGDVRPDFISDPWALMRGSEVPQATAYVTTSWIHPTEQGRVEWVHEHRHDYDELLMFLGNDSGDPDDLGGTVFLQVEGEEHRLTTTSCVFVPAGTRHCPLGFDGVQRPLRFMAVAMSGDGTY